MIKKGMIVLVGVVFLLGNAWSNSAQAAKPPHGTEVGSFSGVKAFSNGPTHNINGASGKYGWNGQCVEYVNRYYAEALGHKNMKGTGHARSYFGTAKNKGLEAFNNGGTVVPRPGDLLCFDDSSSKKPGYRWDAKTEKWVPAYGHVAIVREVGPDYIRIIQQNWSNNAKDNGEKLDMTKSSDGVYKIKGVGRYGIQGWLHKPGASVPSLVKGSGPEVYLIENGKKRHILSEENFKLNKKYNWEDVLTIPDADLAKYETDVPVSLLVKGSGPEVYVIENGKKRWITTAEAFNQLGYNWSDIITISDSDLAKYPTGKRLIYYPDGTLLKGSGPEVYLVENGKKRHITSPGVLEASGYSWSQIKSIPDSELNGYPTGTNLTCPDGTLVKGPGPEVYVIQNGYKRWITSASVFNAWGYRWSDIRTISDGALRSFPTGSSISTSFALAIRSELTLSIADTSLDRSLSETRVPGELPKFGLLDQKVVPLEEHLEYAGTGERVKPGEAYEEATKALGEAKTLITTGAEGSTVEAIKKLEEETLKYHMGGKAE